MRRKTVNLPAIELDFPFRGLVNAGNEVEYGGFSRPVRPNQPPDLTEVDLQVVVLNGTEASEVVSHVVDPKERHVSPPRRTFASVGGGS